MPTVPPQEQDAELYDFEREVRELVRDTAPQLFAVVAAYNPGGADEDACVVAWGLAGDGWADVVAVEGTRRLRLTAPEHAARYFGRAAGCVVRLVWLAPCDVVDGPLVRAA